MPALRQTDDAPIRPLALPEPRWIAGATAVDSPVRDLHDRLLEAFAEEPARRRDRPGLTLRAKAGAMLGTSALLWGMIAMLCYWAI